MMIKTRYLVGSGPKFTFFSLEKIESTTGTRDLTTHCTEISIEDGSCMPYITVEFRMSKIETVIERRYYRIFDLISDVGGMRDIICHVLTALSAVYISTRYKKWVILEFYGPQINPEEIGIGVNQDYHQGPSTKPPATIRTKELLKNSKNRDLIFSGILEKMDVMNYIKFSQKASILSQLAPINTSCYKSLTPQVYFNLSKKLKKRKEEEENTETKYLRPEQLRDAYTALAKSDPNSKFEKKLKKIFKTVIEDSGKIDIDTIAMMRNLPEGASNLEPGPLEGDKEGTQKLEEVVIFSIPEEPEKTINNKKEQKTVAHNYKKKMIVKSSFRKMSKGKGLRQSFRLGKAGSKMLKAKEKGGFQKNGLVKR